MLGAADDSRWPVQTNWAALVARGVDEAGGQGWVTELAGSTEPLLELLANSDLRDAGGHEGRRRSCAR